MSGSSEWSSGSESGWTLYLDHSVSSSPSPSCLRDSNGFDNRRRSKDSWSQNYVHQEEEEDLSMISDASSGPRNICEEGSVKILNNVGPKIQSKRENKRIDYEKMNSLLDDTASSHVSFFFKEKSVIPCDIIVHYLSLFPPRTKFNLHFFFCNMYILNP